MPCKIIYSYAKIEDIPERHWNRKIIKSINESLFDFDIKKERAKKEKNRLKNKIWQKNSNIIPKDLDERIEKYLDSKKINFTPRSTYAGFCVR